MVDKQEMLDEVESQIKNLFDETYEVMNWQDLSPELVQSIQIDNAEGIIMLGILYLVIAFGIFGTYNDDDCGTCERVWNFDFNWNEEMEALPRNNI